MQTIIFLSLGVVILILVMINAFLFYSFHQTNKKIDQLLEKGKIKDFRDIFLSQKEKNDDLEREIKEAFLKIENLENASEMSIRKIGVLRFNAFESVGGNQSFVIAMMDNKNNGFLISSLFGENGNRVYAKTIKQGNSDYPLSREEVSAISKAMNNNG